MEMLPARRVSLPAVLHVPVGNRLLASLPRRDARRFVAACESVDLNFAQPLYRAGQRIEHVYFPIKTIISLVSSLDGHSSLEIGMVGDEGMIGIPLVLDMKTSPMAAMVQAAGTALRMDAERFKQELEQSLALRRCMKRYIHVLISQFAQTAACSRLHMVEARLARWMLMSQDRAHSDQFHLTHEFLANMLGIRREGVTTAASSLRAKKLIRYHRGNIQVLDRGGLQAASCSCYLVDREVYEAVFGKPWSRIDSCAE
jgi:CRP-like cAMP-binding protein